MKKLLALLLVPIALGTVVQISAQSSSADYPPSPWWNNPPPTHPPAVQIVTPEDGAVILGPSDIEIYAEASHFTDTVSSVEFVANSTNSLGVVTNGLVLPWFNRSAPAYFGLTWSNAPAGDYSLTAIATDADGNSVTSSVVDIQVVTNIPPLVHIIRPRDGQIILSSSNIIVTASAFDPHGTVTDVELFAGTNSIGVDTNAPTSVTNYVGVFTIQNRKYDFDWTDPVPGDYALTAVATDNGGVSSTSCPVNVIIVTNLPPRCVSPVSLHGRD
jgi:chitinase